MTGFFQRLMRHTYQEKKPLTEEVLQEIGDNIMRLRGQLLDVFQEVDLAMQALDMLALRMGRVSRQSAEPSNVVHMPVEQPPPIVLSREHRQREGA